MSFGGFYIPTFNTYQEMYMCPPAWSKQLVGSWGDVYWGGGGVLVGDERAVNGRGDWKA